MGSFTKDSELAEAMLLLIRDDRQDLKNNVMENITSLTKDTDPNEIAFIDLYEENKEELELLLESLDSLYKNSVIDGFAHDKKILELANALVVKYPSVAQNLLEKLQVNPAELLDLQVEICVAFFHTDSVKKGIEHFNKIEVEFYKPTAIASLVESHTNLEVFRALHDALSLFEIDTCKYEALAELTKKIDIDFSELYELTSNIMPYDDVRFSDREEYESFL